MISKINNKIDIFLKVLFISFPIFIILGLKLAIYLTSTLTRLYLRKKFNNFLNEINKMNSDLSKEDIFGQSENELLTENFLDNN